MADKMNCPVCDSESSALLRHFRETGECLYCHADEKLMDLIRSLRDEHLEELEAMGVSPYVRGRVQEPPAVTMLIEMHQAVYELKKSNADLRNALRGVQQAVADVAGKV